MEFLFLNNSLREVSERGCVFPRSLNMEFLSVSKWSALTESGVSLVSA